MPAIRLTPAERKEKRGLAHHLDPVVMVGAQGLTPAVLEETAAALDAHGLIKLRVLCEDRNVREAMLAQLADSLGAAAVQHIGKLLVLWRPVAPKDSPLREDRLPGPKLVKIVKFSKSGNHRPQIKKVRVLGNQRVTAGGLIKRAKPRPVRSKKVAVR